MPALKPPKKRSVGAFIDAFVDDLGDSAKQTRGVSDVTAARVEEIAATLRDGSFRHGVTLKAFAEKWGVQYQRVGELSSLANAVIRDELAADHDRIRAKGFAMLERIADEAERGADPKGNTATHLAVAIRAVDTWLTKSGAAAPAASTVTVKQDYSHLSIEQLEQLDALLAAAEEGKK